jgi:integrase
MTIIGSKKEAEAAMRGLLDEVSRLSHSRRRGGVSKATVEGHIEGWLNSYCVTEVKPRTAQTYREILYRHLIKAYGRLKIRDLTAEHIQDLYDDMIKNRDLSAQSVHQLHQALSSCLNSTKKYAGLSFVATDDARPPSIKHTPPSSRHLVPGSDRRREKIAWSPDEVVQFYSLAKGHRYEQLYVLAIHTGMRAGELCGLKWADVDLERRYLTVSRSLQRIKGMGLVEGSPKNGNPRTIDLNELAVWALETEREVQGLRKTMAEEAWIDERWVFSTDTGSGIDRAVASKSFRKLVNPAPFPKIALHELRHTFVSLAALGGVSIEAVSKILGHASIQITIDTYQHLFRSQTQAVVGKIAELAPRG